MRTPEWLTPGFTTPDAFFHRRDAFSYRRYAFTTRKNVIGYVVFVVVVVLTGIVVWGIPAHGAGGSCTPLASVPLANGSTLTVTGDVECSRDDSYTGTVNLMGYYRPDRTWWTVATGPASGPTSRDFSFTVACSASFSSYRTVLHIDQGGHGKSSTSATTTC